MAGSQARIISCAFFNCTAKEIGGGVWVSGFVFYPRPEAPAEIEIVDSTFLQMSAKYGGAVALLKRTRGTIEMTHFRGCESEHSGGAVIMIDRVMASLTNCDFSNNVARSDGGGIAINDDAHVSISNCRFLSNLAQGSLGGGGLYTSHSAITLTVNLFRDNSAPAGGGGAVRWEGKQAPVVLRTCELGMVIESIDGMLYCLPCSMESTSDCSISGNQSLASLNEHGRWICDRAHKTASAHGNHAQYGPCVATGYHSLDVIGLPAEESPGYAGVNIGIEVSKLDRYGQVITSDSTSSLQMYPSLGQSLGNDPSVSFVGSTFSVFQSGRATFSVAVRPTFSTVSMAANRTALYREPFVYFTGTDSERGLKMSTPALHIHLASGDVPACRPGSVLVMSAATGMGQPGVCSLCKIGQYSSHPLSPPCKKCPKVIRGKTFAKHTVTAIRSATTDLDPWCSVLNATQIKT